LVGGRGMGIEGCDRDRVRDCINGGEREIMPQSSTTLQQQKQKQQQTERKIPPEKCVAMEKPKLEMVS